MEVEPSGTSLSVNSRLAWQQEVRSSATQSSGQSCNYAAGGPQAMHVNDTADSSVVDQAYSVALCSVEDLASAMCDEEQSESVSFAVSQMLHARLQCFPDVAAVHSFTEAKVFSELFQATEKLL